jgi:hypothetical protein
MDVVGAVVVYRGMGSSLPELNFSGDAHVGNGCLQYTTLRPQLLDESACHLDPSLSTMCIVTEILTVQTAGLSPRSITAPIMG